MADSYVLKGTENEYLLVIRAEDEKAIYQIVGDDEADIKSGKISISSPIARALIGKSEGDVAEVVAPSGIRSYEVLNVQYI